MARKKIVKKENTKLIAFTDEAMAILKQETKSGTPLTEAVNNIITKKDSFNPVAEAYIKYYQDRYGATRKQALEALVLQSFEGDPEPQKGEPRQK